AGRRAWPAQNAGRNVNVNREPTPHRQRVGGFKICTRAGYIRARSMLGRTVNPRERLGAQASGGALRQVHESRSTINGHGPIISGDVPIELIMVGEEADCIRRRVRYLDCLGGVHRAGNVNFELTDAARSAALILELVTVVVRDLLNL